MVPFHIYVVVHTRIQPFPNGEHPIQEWVPHIRIFVTGCDSSMGWSIPEWGTLYSDSPPVTNRISLFASGGTPFKNTFLFVNGVPQLGIASFPYAGAAEAEKSKTAVKCRHRPPFYIVFLMPTLCPSQSLNLFQSLKSF